MAKIMYLLIILLFLKIPSVNCLKLEENPAITHIESSNHPNLPIGWKCCIMYFECPINKICCFSICSYTCQNLMFIAKSTRKDKLQKNARTIFNNEDYIHSPVKLGPVLRFKNESSVKGTSKLIGYPLFSKQFYKMSLNSRMSIISNGKLLKRRNVLKNNNEMYPVLKRNRRSPARRPNKKAAQKNRVKSPAQSKIKKNKKEANLKITKKNTKKSTKTPVTPKAVKTTKTEKRTKNKQSGKKLTPKAKSKVIPKISTTKNSSKFYIKDTKIQEPKAKLPLDNGLMMGQKTMTYDGLNNISFSNASKENKASPNLKIFHGIFNLNLDTLPLDFFDQLYWRAPNRKAERCIFRNWDEEEINVIFLDTLMNGEDNEEFENPPEILGDESFIVNFKLNQFMNRTLNEKMVPDRQESRVKNELDDGLNNNNNGTQKIISRIVSPTKHVFNTSENDEINLVKTEHLVPKVVDVSYENFTTLKPSIQKEQGKKLNKKISEWVMRSSNGYGNEIRRKINLVDVMKFSEKNLETKRIFQNLLVQRDQPTEFETSISFAPYISFENFSNLINFVGEKLSKIQNLNMLLLSNKKGIITSEKMSLRELFYQLTEEALNVSNNKQIYKIVLTHFVTGATKDIIKNKYFQSLKLKFREPLERESLASKPSDKYFFTNQVMENCLSIPLQRKSVFQVHFPDNLYNKIPVKLKILNSMPPSKGCPGKLNGTFILQMKNREL